MALVDTYGRRIKYLRLSVTDRCNLRCKYCMPAEGVPKLAHNDVLSYEQLCRVAEAAVGLGIDKIRITGGEPLVRKGIIPFLDRVAAIVGLRELVLTTNGVMLGELAAPLRRAGVARLNVSLDSLRPDVFAGITRGGDLGHVLDGLAAALDAGFPAPKINVVVMRGINDMEISEFANVAVARSCAVRFIEYMPTRGAQDWHNYSVSGAEILTKLRERHTLLPVQNDSESQPAKNFRIDGSAGTVGIISPVSQHFCDTCDRIRVTASGIAKACLFDSGAGVDLKPYLAGNDDGLSGALKQLVWRKPDRHRLSVNATESAWLAMSQIGG
jgi:cyclic pyranopterin phosphate synthase